MATSNPSYFPPDKPSPDAAESTILDEVLDLLITEFADERLFFDSTPPPLLFGLVVDDDPALVDRRADWRSNPSAWLDLMIRPLWEGDPIDSINEFRAPPHWEGLGLVAASTARVDSQGFDITLGVVVDREGALSARLVSSDGFTELITPITARTDSGEGQLVDALRQALGGQALGGQALADQTVADQTVANQTVADCTRLNTR